MTRAEKSQTIGLGAILTALLLSAMWGGNMVGIKVSLEAIPPVWGAVWRMTLGLPLLWLWARAGDVELRPGPGELKRLWILAALFATQIVFLNWSIHLTTAAYSAVLTNAAPLFTNVIAHYVVPGDRITRNRLLGILLAFAGVVLVVAGKPDARLATAPLAGNLLAVFAAAMIGSRIVFTQRLVQKLHPIRTIFWQVLLSIPMLLTVAVLTEPMTTAPVTNRVLIALGYCSFLVVGVAFILWVRLLQKHPPGMLTVFVFPAPLFGVLFSSLVYQERLGSMLLGGMLAVAFWDSDRYLGEAAAEGGLDVDPIV